MISARTGLAPAASTLRSTTSQVACRYLSISTRCASNYASKDKTANRPRVDMTKLLQQPAWSIAGLLSEGRDTPNETVSEMPLEKLRRLLRLSALPFSTSPQEQSAKLKALLTQLNFVRNVQDFDAAETPPLQAIRDETHNALKEQTIGVKEVADSLLQEEYFGRNRRPRRRRAKEDASGSGSWDVLETASQKAGRYIVVGNNTKQ